MKWPKKAEKERLSTVADQSFLLCVVRTGNFRLGHRFADRSSYIPMSEYSRDPCPCQAADLAVADPPVRPQ